MRLKELRIELGMNQNEVSQLLNISQMAYSYYERGLRQPDIKMLIKLSKLFSVSVDYLIENEDERLDKLTDGERAIISKYRNLNQANKYKIEERIDVFLEQQNKK